MQNKSDTEQEMKFNKLRDHFCREANEVARTIQNLCTPPTYFLLTVPSEDVFLCFMRALSRQLFSLFYIHLVSELKACQNEDNGNLKLAQQSA